MAIASDIWVLRALAIASVVSAVSHSPGDVCSFLMCCSNFGQFVMQCRRCGVSVGVMFRVLMVIACFDDPIVPSSHDQFWAAVVQCPLIQLRSMIVGFWRLCGNRVNIPGMFSSVKPRSWVYSTRGSACRLVLIILSSMRGSTAISAYHKLWWQLKSPNSMVFS